MVKKTYAIEVCKNGWMNNCPDWEGVFFGETVKMPGALGVPEYALIVFGAKERNNILKVLNTTGDWSNDDGEERPTYKWRMATANECFITQEKRDELECK